MCGHGGMCGWGGLGKPVRTSSDLPTLQSVRPWFDILPMNPLVLRRSSKHLPGIDRLSQRDAVFDRGERMQTLWRMSAVKDVGWDSELRTFDRPGAPVINMELSSARGCYRIGNDKSGSLR